MIKELTNIAKNGATSILERIIKTPFITIIAEKGVFMHLIIYFCESLLEP